MENKCHFNSELKVIGGILTHTSGSNGLNSEEQNRDKNSSLSTDNIPSVCTKQAQIVSRRPSMGPTAAGLIHLWLIGLGVILLQAQWESLCLAGWLANGVYPYSTLILFLPCLW